ncbi:hypothetical protein BDZ94DRAFT_738869 [Collybia nuda]|uniref:Uncharacterized protein n=1 Tax=Collybia nuda TaxID=64659 RepID=A0A9P5Y522_9AGAR|nr:hypothetical protein BDZ94DRAFT_738869 [Collybia nuda]
MSNILPPLVIPTSDERTTKSAQNVSLPPLSSWSDGYRALDSIGSSSSPRSSSPPMTPFSSRSSQSHAFIQSSPRIAFETRHPHNDHMDDHLSAWDRNYMHYPSSQASIIPHTLPSIKAIYENDIMMRSTPPLYVSKPSEKIEFDFGEQQADITNSVASRYPSTFYDSEEEHEGEDESEGYSFVEEGARATFFRTSAERGQWKTDPAALKMQSRWQMRQSAPTWSPPPVSGLQYISRPISEPAHPTSRASSPADFPDSHDEHKIASELPSTPFVDDVSPDHLNHAVCDLSSSPPSLTSDREPSHEPGEMHYPSSPLPPSSPPLSPVSLPVSPMMRSMSPLSFVSSSPFMPPSSPLSFPPSDHDNDDMDLENEIESDGALPGATSEPVLSPTALVLEPSICIETSLSPPVAGTGAEVPPALFTRPLIATPELEPADKGHSPEPALDTPTSSDLPEEAPSVTTAVIPPSITNPGPSTDDGTAQGVCTEASMDIDIPPNQVTQVPNVLNLFGTHEAQVSTAPIVVKSSILDEVLPIPKKDPKVEVPNVLDLFNDLVEEPLSLETSVEKVLEVPQTSTNDANRSKAKTKTDKALKVRDHNGAMDVDEKGEGPSSAEARVGKPKRKKVVEGERRYEGPVRKKSRSSISETTISESHSSSVKGKFKADEPQKAKADGKRRHEEEDETFDVAPQPKARKQRRVDNASKNRPQQASRVHSDNSTASSSKRPLPVPIVSPSKSKPKNPETAALDAEICGLLIESMATSRASCLPASFLYKSVMQCRPSLKAQRSEKEWMEVFERVLRDGEASHGSGVFGKVESSGKDDSDRPLEAQWFYVPEADDDQERATLIRSMMPRPGKRSETKKYKQYYYRPLEKISRWDPEDEI